MNAFAKLQDEIGRIRRARRIGRVAAIGGGVLDVTGLSRAARLGDRVRVLRGGAADVDGEVLRLTHDGVTVLPDAFLPGIAIGDAVELLGGDGLYPDDGWIGRVLDPFGAPLDGRPVRRGTLVRPLRPQAPEAAKRRALGARLDTGLAAFNTLLPLVRGQRIGLFAGSGVGKSMLLAKLACGVAADVVVIAMIGERGRELREFTENVLGPEGMKRAIVIAATSDQSALVRRRAAWAAMAVAEHFRDSGAHVLLLADSITRFAEAHREIALMAGESGSLRGYPPSVAHLISALAERAGPGPEGTAGDITALFSVLVAGSDMEEPVADILRGVLDGHVVLDREIAERGRFPAIDPIRSVSRSLPGAASPQENSAIARARQLLGAYARAEMMIQAGLYTPGSDPLTDAAIRAWPELDAFLAQEEPGAIDDSFARLRACLDIAEETAQPAESR